MIHQHLTQLCVIAVAIVGAALILSIGLAAACLKNYLDEIQYEEESDHDLHNL